MFNPTRIQQQYYNLLSKAFGLEKAVKNYQINFDKPFYYSYFKQPIISVIAWGTWILANIADFFIPTIIAQILETQNLNLLFWLIVGIVTRYSVSAYSLYLLVIIEKSLIHNFQLQLTKFFLLIDPVELSTKSSGQIISKIDRGILAITDILIKTTFSFVPALSGITVSFWLLSRQNIGLGIFAIVFSAMQVFLIFKSIRSTNQFLIKKTIPAEDNFKSAQLESIQQTNFIRSVFATPEIATQLKKKSYISASLNAIKNYGLIFILTFTRYLYVINIAFVIYWYTQELKSGNVSLAVAVSVILTYSSAMAQIVDLGNVLDSFTNNVLKVQDLFDFVKDFAKPTFPALPDDDMSR